MDYALIKLSHLVGIFLLLMGLSGMAFAAKAGFGPAKRQLRLTAQFCHGGGLLLILASGFGMLASRGLLHGDVPGWVKAKFFIWLLMGGSIVLATRLSRALWSLILAWALLGATAAYLALYKPF